MLIDETKDDTIENTGEEEITEEHEEVQEPTRAAKRINQLVGKLKQQDSNWKSQLQDKDKELSQLAPLKKINDILIKNPELDQQVRALVNPYLNPNTQTSVNTQSALEERIKKLEEERDVERTRKAQKEIEDNMASQLSDYQDKEKLSDDQMDMLASIIDSKDFADDKGKIDFTKARPVLDKWLGKTGDKDKEVVVTGGGSRIVTPPADNKKKLTEQEAREQFLKEHPHLA